MARARKKGENRYQFVDFLRLYETFFFKSNRYRIEVHAVCPKGTCNSENKAFALVPEIRAVFLFNIIFHLVFGVEEKNNNNITEMVRLWFELTKNVN